MGRGAMRILVLDAIGVATTGRSFARAFRAMGHEVTQLDPVEIMNANRFCANKRPNPTLLTDDGTSVACAGLANRAVILHRLHGAELDRGRRSNTDHYPYASAAPAFRPARVGVQPSRTSEGGVPHPTIFDERLGLCRRHFGSA